MHHFDVKKMIPIYLIGIMLLVFSGNSGNLWAQTQNLEIHYINVQQGQSILIIGPDGTTILCDAGEVTKGTNMVVPYLQGQGIYSNQALDYIVATHLHTDHFRGLTEVIGYGYDVLRIYYNGSDYYNSYVQSFMDAAAATSAGGLTAISLGTVINLGNGATATCVAVNGSVIGTGAISGGQDNENDRSICLLIQYGNFDYLITGDLGGGMDDYAYTGRSTTQVNIETPLAQALMPGGSHTLLSSYGLEVAHVGHHGSESSTNSDYMNLFTPSVACISVGAGQGSGWYHPRIDVVENVLLAGASNITAPSALVLQTEEGAPTGATTSFAGYCAGNIVISTDGIETYSISADGSVFQGPDERSAAGLPVTYYLDEEDSPEPGSSNVVFSEVYYDTIGTDSLEEWIELYNNSSSEINISGWTITDNNGTGSTYTIPQGSTIASHTYFTIAVNSAGFFNLYGRNADLYGAIPALNNDGDALILKNSSGTTIDTVAWEGGASAGVPAGWGSNTSPTATTGSTIVRSNVSVDTNTYSDWTTASNNGNPQTQSSGGGSSSIKVVFSEIYYDTIGTDSLEEWIELYNNSTVTADVSGWTITDNNDTGSTFIIPSGTTIAAGTYLTIAVNSSGFYNLYSYNADVYGAIPALNNSGDALILKDNNGVVQDTVAWEGGASAGVPSGWGSTSLPLANTGYSIKRTSSTTDTNTYADWTTATNNGNPQTQN